MQIYVPKLIISKVFKLITYFWHRFNTIEAIPWIDICLYAVIQKSNNISFSMIHLLTHWGRITHICESKLTIIGSDNGLSPERHQFIVWTNAGILIIGNVGTNLNDILGEIHTFSLKKMHLKTSSTKWWPLCLDLNVLTLPASDWRYYVQDNCHVISNRVRRLIIRYLKILKAWGRLL